MTKQIRSTQQKWNLIKAIDSLGHRSKTIVALYYYEELSVAEIADVMTLSIFRVEQLLRAAKKILRKAVALPKELSDD